MRYLEEKEAAEIKKLAGDGWKIKDLSKKFNVCRATISNVLMDRRSARSRKENRRGPKRGPYVPVDFKEEVLMGLPDEILFQHVKAYDFMG
jgi:hypothetical protein